MSRQALKYDLDSNVFDEELSNKNFTFFSKKMYELAGVNLPLSSKNLALVKNRLARILRNRQLSSYEEYSVVLNKGGSEVVNEFISALTTNKTNFFREDAHFDFLKNYLQGHFESKGSHDLRIWCAASSTGQEPYTISIVLNEVLNSTQLNYSKILATDIDLQVLSTAVKGVFGDNQMEGLSKSRKQTFFQSKEVNGQQFFRAQDSIAKLIHFAPFNLVKDTYNFKKGFHVIFCRNVLIYFDEVTTKNVIENLASSLVPGGYLIIGHSETGNIRSPQLKSMSRAVFQKI
jgi:chemotaxis protein methyltransferase CheR